MFCQSNVFGAGRRSVLCWQKVAHAQSKADFINKVSIALKEANETLYWLNLLKATGYLAEVEHKSIYEDAEELVRILVAILKTSKKNR